MITCGSTQQHPKLKHWIIPSIVFVVWCAGGSLNRQPFATEQWCVHKLALLWFMFHIGGIADQSPSQLPYMQYVILTPTVLYCLSTDFYLPYYYFFSSVVLMCWQRNNGILFQALLCLPNHLKRNTPVLKVALNEWIAGSLTMMWCGCVYMQANFISLLSYPPKWIGMIQQTTAKDGK
jgi:hypothetical protein